MDTISVGGTVAFAVECFENGILTEDETGGLKLTWGNAEAIVALVKKIIDREGIGDVLADRVKKAAWRIGRGSEKYAVHAGGQELPMHDPKKDPMLGTTYSADLTPGRHTTSGGTYYSTSFLWDYVSWVPPFRKHLKSEDCKPSVEEAMKNVAMTSYKMLIDGTGSCYYAMLTGVQHFRIFDYINHATGWNRSPDDYMEIGKRIQTFRQLFNEKHGIDPAAFKMHDRGSGILPLESGHNKGITLKIDAMAESYRAAGAGIPRPVFPMKKPWKN